MPSVEEYTAWFEAADTDGSGMISRSELSASVKGKGYSSSQVDAIFNTADTSGDNKMSLDEFLASMGACDPKVHRQAVITALCRSFDQNGDGQIDAEELKAALNEARAKGDEMTDDEANRLLAEVDADGSGTISYKELLKRLGYDIDD